jgi:ubiquinone/menaquinone biosynthesis C-methylase UbiE
MQPLDLQYWTAYAKDHAKHYNYEMSKFVSDLAVSLRCTSALEVGCSAGNDLMLFPENIHVAGVDVDEGILEYARKNLPKSEFKVGSVTSIHYEDSSFDFVFTKNLLNHIEDSRVQNAMDELFRVSRKYVMNIEAFSEDESVLSDRPVRTAGRNMLKRWMDYKVKIISNVDMHEEIDPKRSRFTLVRKI